MNAAERAILEARARALAKRVETGDSAETAGVEVLRVRVGNTSLALSTRAVASVARAPRVTALPHASFPVYGLAAWRGRPLTMLSVRPQVAEDGAMMVVIGDGRRAQAALLVDDVDLVETLDERTLTAAPPGPLARFALGVSADAVLVVDPARMIASLPDTP